MCVCQGQLASEMVISCCTGVKLDMENKTSYLSLSKCLLKPQDEDCFLRGEKMKTILSMPLKKHPNQSWFMKTYMMVLKRYNGFSNFHKGKKVKLTLNWLFFRYYHIKIFLDFLVEGSSFFFLIKEMIDNYSVSE